MATNSISRNTPMPDELTAANRQKMERDFLSPKGEIEYQARIREAEDAERCARLMLDSIPLGSFMIDESGILACNETAVRMAQFGSKQEMIDNYFDIIPEYQPDGRVSREVVADARRRAFEEGHVNYEFRYVLRNGEEVLVDTTINRVPWNDGYRLVTYSRDLKPLKEQEERLRAAEEHTRVMLDATPFGCILMNKNLESIDCNTTALKIWEMDSKEDLLNNYHEVFPEKQPDGYDSAKRVYEMRKKALDTGVAVYPFTFQLRSGEIMPVEVRVQRVEWKDEPMLVGYVRDMRAEYAARRKMDELRNLTQAVLDGVPIGCFVFNEKNEIASCNEEAIKLYGGRDEQDVIKHVFTRNMPEFQPDGRRTVDGCLEMIARTLQTGEIQNFEWMARTAQGDELPTECTIKRISWGDGEYRIVVYVRDMREEVATAQKVKEARNLTQAVLDGVPIGCFVFNEENEIASCNEEAIKLYGGRDEQDVIKNVFTRNMPEFQPDGRRTVDGCLEMIAHTLQTGEIQNFEWMARTAQGDELPTECTIKRISWGDGEYRIVVYVRDMRVEVATAQKVEEARNLTQAVLDGVPIGCFIFNEENEMASCNEEAIKLYGGRDEQDVITHVFTRNMPEFQPDGRRSMENSLAMIIHTMQTGEVQNFEWMARTAQGDELPTECTIKRISWGDGEYRIVVYVRDLRALKRSMAEIEHQQKELVAARDMAEASLESKSVFLANMSHEIRTPITAIIGMTNIAKRSDDPDRVTYCLNKIGDASEHLLGVINDILDFSKIEAGHFLLTPSDFAIDTMLSRLTDIMAFRIDQKQQQFDITIDPHVPHAIVSDQQRLAQVIMNLLANAHKFTPEHGRIALDINLATAAPEDGGLYTLRFTISDNGIGIARDQIERLFESFEQGDNNISRRYGGTGLGLSISKAIITQMNGTIWVESELGVGSSFIFEIPVRRGIASSLSRLDPRIDISGVSASGGTPLRCKYGCSGEQRAEAFSSLWAFCAAAACRWANSASRCCFTAACRCCNASLSAWESDFSSASVKVPCSTLSQLHHQSVAGMS
ncbi:PAS domain-containing protein [Desulfovibrio sp. OttesenSCG-928-I05]|nr:PAS domain-containing protein [Desulfovibrio sp. OttesenSCG-928-I05]